MLHLIPGKAKPGTDEDTEGMSFKQKKALKEKKQAGSSHNWNTLFLGASAVADLMSEKYSVEKSDILTGDGGKMTAAVKLALGETQIVAETRKFLEEEGMAFVRSHFSIVLFLNTTKFQESCWMPSAGLPRLAPRR